MSQYYNNSFAGHFGFVKKKGSLARNIIDQAPEIMLKPIFKVTTFM